MIFAYARVSTHKESQKTDRQLLAMREYAAVNGFDIDETIEETMSGKSMERPAYQFLRGKMRRGDILLLSDIDRIGRNADQVIMEFKHLKADGIKVVALDTPYLNVWGNVNDDSLYWMIVDILITLKAHLAQQEREKTIARINQGLDVARQKGHKLGRPAKTVSGDVIKMYQRVQSGELNKTEAAKLLGISRQHFDTLIKKTGNVN